MFRNKIKKGNFAVIFSYDKSKTLKGYKEMNDLTLKQASETEGYLGHEFKGDETGGIFISYWKNKEAINIWRTNSIHK